MSEDTTPVVAPETQANTEAPAEPTLETPPAPETPAA